MRIRQRRHGWIGVDIGTTTIKLAQIERTRQGWKLNSAAVVPRQDPWTGEALSESKLLSSANELLAARSLQEDCRGRKAAAVLPMAVCDVHRLDRNVDEQANASKLLRSAIETDTQRPLKELQCDYWTSPLGQDKPGWTQALSVPRPWTEQLCEDVAKAGWFCEAIDGLPMVAARAVGLLESDAGDVPLAVLDWGSSRTTLCLLEHGLPNYVRCLKNCDLRSVLGRLETGLEVSEIEAQRLLEEYGLASPADGCSSELAEVVHEILAAPIGNLVDEISRTVSHCQYLRRMERPARLYVMGGGGLIRGIEEYLSSQTNLETHVWRLPPVGGELASEDPRTDCIFGPAVALSALAWEDV